MLHCTCHFDCLGRHHRQDGNKKHCLQEGKSHNYQRCFLLDQCIRCNAGCLTVILLAVCLLSIRCCYVWQVLYTCCFLLLLCPSYHCCCCCCCRSPGRDNLKPLLLATNFVACSAENPGRVIRIAWEFLGNPGNGLLLTWTRDQDELN